MQKLIPLAACACVTTANTMARRRKAPRKKTRTSSKFKVALTRLKKLKAPQQRQAIGMANNAFLRQFVSHIKKLKHAKLSKKQKKMFKKHQHAIRKLVSPRTSMSKRRTILSQKGKGALFSLIKSIPVVGDVISLVESL